MSRSSSLSRELSRVLSHLGNSTKQVLLQWLPASQHEGKMEVDTAAPVAPSAPAPTPSPPRHPPVEPVPEVEIYLRLLIIHHLLSDSSTYAKGLELSQETVQKMQALNRRSMDPIAAKVWYAVERAYELAGDLSEARPYVLHTQSVCSLLIIAVRIDCSCLLSEPRPFVTMMRPKHRSSTVYSATTSTTISTTKPTNLY